MAKKKFASTIEKLEALVEAQSTTQIIRTLKPIVAEAVDVAKGMLDDTNKYSTTQRYQEILSNYVYFERNGDGFRIIAHSGNDEIDQNLFYAEYGAGLSATGGAKYRRERLNAGIISTNNDMSWFYPSNPVEQSRNPQNIVSSLAGREYSITNKSKPIHYMRTAYNYVLKNGGTAIREYIGTRIKSKYRNRKSMIDEDMLPL